MKKVIASLILLLTLLGAIPNTFAVLAKTVPTITILGVTENDRVSFQTHDFPADKVFDVRMGPFGTKGVNGTLADTVDSGAGGSETFTVEIPTSLQSQSMIAIRLESTTSTHYAYNWFYNQTYGSHEEGEDIPSVPNIVAVSVKAGENVTIKGYNFPAEATVRVLMDAFGTQAEDGLEVETFDSGEGGTITRLVPIPESLADAYKIAIRFESTEGDLSTSTWFINQTGDSGGTGTGTVTSIPTITILSVVQGDSVTVKTHNFPAGKDFNVLMGVMGTRGIGGIKADAINSGGGGSLTETFAIPAALQDNAQIAIRLETSDGVTYAYNWFYNNTSDGGNGSNGNGNGYGNSGYTGFPTISFTGILQGDQVTIKTNNFPEDVEFIVLMGQMGTKGIGGIQVTTINSGSGGTFSKTFDIPEALAGENQIAIRLESASGTYYAYNWFYNQTYP
jgi:hypothetical protein